MTMADPRNDDFLDDVDDATNEEYAQDLEEMDNEAVELEFSARRA